jgi:hypothetical protein
LVDIWIVNCFIVVFPRQHTQCMIIAGHACPLDRGSWQLPYPAISSVPATTVARTENMDLTRMLIMQGMDASARDIYKWTPLHCTAQKGSVGFLIEVAHTDLTVTECIIVTVCCARR